MNVGVMDFFFYSDFIVYADKSLYRVDSLLERFGDISIYLGILNLYDITCAFVFYDTFACTPNF